MTRATAAASTRVAIIICIPANLAASVSLSINQLATAPPALKSQSAGLVSQSSIQSSGPNYHFNPFLWQAHHALFVPFTDGRQGIPFADSLPYAGTSKHRKDGSD